MWQGHLTLKNESAAVQLHFLSGNVQLAKGSLPGTGEGRSPALRIAQRMRLEQTQLEGVQRRMQVQCNVLYMCPSTACLRVQYLHVSDIYLYNVHAYTVRLKHMYICV